MKYHYLLPIGIALLTMSCKGKKTASTNPYQNNPYYGPSSTGNSTTDYSSTPSSSNYPSYSESTYTPPTTPSVPSVPTVPTYQAPATTTYTPAATAGSHTVSRGENLYRISLAHNTSVAAIKSANGLSTDTIHPGQVLRIP